MHFLYIIYSHRIDRFYTGETSNIEERLEQHNSGYFKKSYTSQASDWKIKLSLEFETIEQARAAETFVKRMNSRKFITRLIEDSEWFILKFKK